MKTASTSDIPDTLDPQTRAAFQQLLEFEVGSYTDLSQSPQESPGDRPYGQRLQDGFALLNF